ERPPAGTVATTVFVAVSMTDRSLLTAWSPSLVMYANGAALAPAAPVNTATPANHSAIRTLRICALPSLSNRSIDPLNTGSAEAELERIVPGDQRSRTDELAEGDGTGPHRYRGHHQVRRRVDHRHGVIVGVRDVHARAVP